MYHGRMPDAVFRSAPRLPRGFRRSVFGSPRLFFRGIPCYLVRKSGFFAGTVSFLCFAWELLRGSVLDRLPFILRVSFFSGILLKSSCSELFSAAEGFSGRNADAAGHGGYALRLRKFCIFPERRGS